MMDTFENSERVPGMRPGARVIRRDALHLDRLPPHSDPAEQGMLGCILLSPKEAMGECLEKFKGKPEVFYDERHKAIFNCLRVMYAEQEAIDLITVQQRLKNQKILEEVGGIAYLSQLQDAVPSAANLSYYLAIVRDKYLLRKMIKLGADLVGRVYDYEGDVDALLDEVEQDFSQLTEQEMPQKEAHIRTVLGRVLNDLEENRYIRGKTQLRGLPTGPEGNYMDKLLRGVREQFFWTVAGRPGTGKTSYAMNVVEYLATEYVWHKKTGRILDAGTDSERPELRTGKGIPIGVISLEMDGDSLVSRMLFGRAGVDQAEFMMGFAEKEADFTAKLAKAAAELAQSNIYIDDTPAQSVEQIAAKARRMAAQYGIEFFVLDYFQLLEEEDGRYQDRVRFLTRACRKIVMLKKQLKVPWMVLCQMNRDIETADANREPRLSDLAECSALEKDSDAVSLFYKPSRKQLESAKEGELSDKEILESVCKDWPWSLKPYRVNQLLAKNRFGPTGKVELLFQKNLCRYHDWHLWKVQHGAEARNAGESKGLEGQRPLIDDADVPTNPNGNA